HVGQGLVADKAPAAATAGAADRCGPGNTRINLGMASILLVVARNEGRARRRRVERCRGGRRAGKSDASLFARSGTDGPDTELVGRPAETALDAWLDT